jgi:alpha-mannosidase
VEKNQDYHFFLDGQTLVVEDLLNLKPDYREAVDWLVQSGSLLIGPYYCQPDWKLADGETLLRNLLYGQKDLKKYQGEKTPGWLVDTFGHISQAPQLHKMFGIEAVFLWRGAPKLEPYFTWRGPDGSILFTINLFGGYRNLYGVTHAPEIGSDRLKAELNKLEPFYPTQDIPLFDGYDLEVNPEDPVSFFQELPPGELTGVQIKEAAPGDFAREMVLKLDDLPTISGELNSGKYGAVFPGTLSARTYLKVMKRDCEYLLYKLCEPWGALAALRGRNYPSEQYENWSRVLLQNAVHDCICGVSIDQVHEKMEFTYRQTFDAMQADMHESLAFMLADFAPGSYAVSTNPYPYEGWSIEKGSLSRIKTDGIGVWQITDRLPINTSEKIVETFSWKNSHYEARIDRSGTVGVGEAVFGSLLVFEEKGDTYSGEKGQYLGKLQTSGPLRLEQESDIHARLSIPLSFEMSGIRVDAVLHLIFDASPLISWEIELESRGTNFRVEIVFNTSQKGEIFAGMPFDVVKRPQSDDDLLPRILNDNLSDVLLGQRELGVNRTFPFHDFVAFTDGAHSAAVLAKGLHAYEANENGRISIILSRNIEWLTKPNLNGRTGDAGPFFYVPDARCERSVWYELAVFSVDSNVEDPAFHSLVAGYQNPPVTVVASGNGRKKQWGLFQEYLPLSSMQIVSGRVLIRLYNPRSLPHLLSNSYIETNVSGKSLSKRQVVDPKKIITILLDEIPLPETAFSLPVDKSQVKITRPHPWRVGPNQGQPETGIIERLKSHFESLDKKIAEISERLKGASGWERYKYQHELYVVRREQLETRLTIRLNEKKLLKQASDEKVYLFNPDDEIAEIGRELNRMRIMRRIYDYIVQIVK